MPRVPTLSPATGKPVPAHFIHTTAGQFVDTAGRTVIFRGVNLSGSSKAPAGQQSQVLEGFWEDAHDGGRSFAGQPLNLDDGSADVHLARLRGWGFNVLRFPVTWEALEHEAPKKYDYEYMDYVVRVLRKCKEHGFKVFMDPHQDVWSRFTGGSGAPLWTIYACGMDPRNFTQCGAHMLHSEYPSPSSPDPASFPAMMWSTNYGRLASQTLYTLFFAGRDFAPKCIIDGQNIQDWLQAHYIGAFGALADTLASAGDLLDECVIGWDSLNEPSEGFVGYDDLRFPSAHMSPVLKKGPFPVPAQSLRLGMGLPQTLEVWDFGGFGPKKTGSVLVDPKGVKAWLDPESKWERQWGWKRDPGWTLGMCVWALHGVWDPARTPSLKDDNANADILLPEYFARRPAAARDEGHLLFMRDYFLPHLVSYTQRVVAAHPEAIIFVQPPVFTPPPPDGIPKDVTRGRAAYSTHYYDGLTLVGRHWHWYNADALGVLRGKYKAPWMAAKIGESAIRASLQEQLGVLKSDSEIIETMPDGGAVYPTIIGEIGIPYDMDGCWSYGYTDNGKGLGKYSQQEKALDASLNACDGPNALNYAIWTYVPDGSHEWGDGWNGEDLSLWCADDLRSKRPPPGSAWRMRQSRLELLKDMSTPSLSIGAGKDAEQEEMGSWDNTYDFLTDGARAPRAFVRPYPAAIVGVPVRWDLNIAKATFSCVVRVGSDDAPHARSGDEGEPPTEVYLPIVHFAGEEALVGVWENDAVPYDEEDEAPVASTSASASASVSQVELTQQPGGKDDELEQDEAADGKPGLPRKSTSGTSRTLLSPASGLSSAPQSLIDVDVTVSDGRYEIRGQTLRWWYRVPARGEPPAEYTLEVRRRGGPIRLDELGRPVRGQGAASAGWGVFCAEALRDCFS